MAMSLFYLIVFTLIAGLACYLVGLVLRKFVPTYRDFQYRLSLPIIACCVGSIGALLVMTQSMSLFLVDALYRFAFVRQYSGFSIGGICFVGYGLGGYYSTKYTMRLAHKLDLRRMARRDNRGSQNGRPVSLQEVERELFKD
jgi:hypothetical protein